jgi:hypothetical protein
MGNTSSNNKKDSYILSYTNGDKYEGEVLNGVREGHGIYYYHNGDKYEGWWQNNKKHGMGTLYYKDGNLYIGQWRNSEKEGIGTLYFRNGEKYYGEFKSGKKNGKGYLVAADGNKFIGHFKDNKKDGKGVIYYKKNKIAREEWNDGVLISSNLLATTSENKNSEVNNLLSSKEFDISFDNYLEDQIQFHQNQNSTSDKFKSKFFTLEVAKYFKARIPNNYFDAMQIVVMTSDIIYDNPHITEWGDEEICEWLSRLGLEQYQEIFKQNCINGFKFIKLNVYDLKMTLGVKESKDIKLVLKSIDFLRIFVKLKLDYQDYMEYEKQKEMEILNNPNLNINLHHKCGLDLPQGIKEKDIAANSQTTANFKSMLTNANTNNTANNNLPQGNERKLSDGIEIHTISKEESKIEEGIVENQEYVLTKMAISKKILF